MKGSRLVLTVLVVTAACTGGATDPTLSDSNTSPVGTSASTVDAPDTVPSPLPDDLGGLNDLAFADFLENSYELLLLRTPEFLTSLGVSADYGLRNDRLNDLSPEYLEQTQALEVEVLDRLRSYDRETLASDDQVSYDVYEWYLDQQVRGHRFAYHDYPVHHFVNSYNFNLILFLTEEHPLETVEDAEDYITRLSLIDDQVAQLMQRLEISEDLGVMPPAVIVAWTSGTLQGDLGGTRDANSVRVRRLPLYESFEARIELIENLDDAARSDLLARAEAELETSFVPAWISLIDHVEGIRTEASSDAGVWRLPDGDLYYEYLLRDHTSTELTAGEIHQIGLENVARVEGELRAAFSSLGYPADASIGELRGRARNDAGFVDGAAAPDQAIRGYTTLIDTASQRMRESFKLWPVAEVEIVPEAAGRGGYYVAASVDGSRPGAFHAGVGGQIALYTMPTITFHEAVPGHHTQIAIAQELELPTFRRFIQYNGFAEGWALYAERLAADAGLYLDDPYGDIGRLELELLRAVRLVVDTGLHSLQWSRAEAQDFMERTISGWSHEVERYMVLPGQATGYMIGMQTILSLREEAVDNGPLDLASFHDLVLGGGSVPLGVLESVVAEAMLDR